MSDEDTTDGQNVGHIASERINRFIAFTRQLASEGRADELLELTRRVDAEVSTAQMLPPAGIHPALARIVREEFPDGFTA